MEKSLALVASVRVSIGLPWKQAVGGFHVYGSFPRLGRIASTLMSLGEREAAIDICIYYFFIF